MTRKEYIEIKTELWLSGEFRGDECDEIMRQIQMGRTFDSACQSVIMDRKI